MSTLMIPGFGWAGMRDKSTVILHTTFAWAVMLALAGTADTRDRGAVKVKSSDRGQHSIEALTDRISLNCWRPVASSQ